MNQVRVLALLTIAAVGVYFVFRAIVAGCSGAACDAYIPVSLLIPIVILALAAATGVVAIARARGRGAWFPALIAAAAAGVLGPVVALLIFKDQPDAFLVVATVLVLLFAGFVLTFSFRLGPR